MRQDEALAQRAKKPGKMKAMVRMALAAALASSCFVAVPAAHAAPYTGAVTIRAAGIDPAPAEGIHLNMKSLQNFEFSTTNPGNLTREGGTVYAKWFDGKGTCTLKWPNCGTDSVDDPIDFALTISTPSGVPRKAGTPNKIFSCWGTRAELASNTETDTGAWQTFTLNAYKAGTTDPAEGRFLVGITDIDQQGEQIVLQQGYGAEVWTNADYRQNMSVSDSNKSWRALDGADNESYSSGFVATFDSTGGQFRRFGGLAAEILNLKVFPDHIVKATADAGGVIDPAGDVPIARKCSRTFTTEALAGHEFSGLLVDGKPVDGVSSYEFSNINEDHAIHARFTPNPYEVAFDANGGIGEMENMAFLYGEAQPLSANAYEKVGYTFAGWNTEADGTGDAYADAEEVKDLTEEKGATVTLFARWTPNDYLVSFDPNGGILSEDYERPVVGAPSDEGDEQPSDGDGGDEPGGPSVDGDATGDAAITASELSDAEGEEGPAIEGEEGEDGDDGADEDVDGQEEEAAGLMTPQAFVYDEAQQLSANAYEKVGYTFAGWNTEADGTGDAYADAEEVKNLTDEVAGAVTLYAQWDPITYVIAYDANGGTGQMQDQEMVYDVSADLAVNGFEREGYEFMGWNTEGAGGGDEYAERQEVLNLTEEDGSIITLYAQWEELPEIKGVPYDKTGIMTSRGLWAAAALMGGSIVVLLAWALRRVMNAMGWQL